MTRLETAYRLAKCAICKIDGDVDWRAIPNVEPRTAVLMCHRCRTDGWAKQKPQSWWVSALLGGAAAAALIVIRACV